MSTTPTVEDLDAAEQAVAEAVAAAAKYGPRIGSIRFCDGVINATIRILAGKWSTWCCMAVPRLSGANIPVTERRGRVFKLPAPVVTGSPMNTDWVGRIVSRIGEAALVMVDQRARSLTLDARSLTRKKPAEPKAESEAPADTVRIKYASAHDLRRAFGLRWSSRVMPAVLQQLMRHESIETTLRFYVGRDAAAVADVLWQAAQDCGSVPAPQKSNKSSNSGESDARKGSKESPQSVAR